MNRRSQLGYLLEIPILLAVVGMVVAIVMPRLPLLGQKILIAIAAVPVLFCLFYMIVTPGWQPGARRLSGPLRLLVFVPLAGVIVFGVVMFALS